MKVDVSIAEQFHRSYYDSLVWKNTTWRGVHAYKCPLDLWIYQEIIERTQPRTIIELGSGPGGSGLFLADVSGAAVVVSVDIVKADRPWRPTLCFIHGSSTDGAVHDHVSSVAVPPVMVIADSDHTKAHVLDELNLYAPLVSPGCYFIVEDTNINGHPVLPGWGDGPAEALAYWLPSHPEFEVDRSCEKFGLTFNPGGYLRRKSF